MKLFFGYSRRDSVTKMLLDIGLPSFATVLLNSQAVFRTIWVNCPNGIVEIFLSLRI